MTARRALATIAAILLAMMFTPQTTSAYAAADRGGSRLLLSYDGTTWHEDLPAMFEPTALVPGDRLSRTLFVRNGSSDAGVLTIASPRAAADAHAGQPLFDELALSVGTPQSAGFAVPFSALADAVLYGASLDPAQTVALEVALTLPLGATSAAVRTQDASFALRLALADEQTTIPGGHNGGTRVLPATGATVVGVWWAIAAIAAGATVAGLDRRRAARRDATARGATTRR